MDTQLFVTINSWAGQVQVLDWLAIFFGKYFIYLFAAGIALLWFQKKYRWQVYLALGSALVNRGIIGEVIKRLVQRPRPYQIIGVHQLIADNELNVSFPSGHAIIFFSLAFAFWGTKYFWPFFILACIASFSRIFAGLHYPSDIVAGAVIGAGLTLAYRWLFKMKILG